MNYSTETDKPKPPPTSPYDPLDPDQNPESIPLPPDVNPEPEPVREPEPEQPQPIIDPQPTEPTRLVRSVQQAVSLSLGRGRPHTLKDA